MIKSLFHPHCRETLKIVQEHRVRIFLRIFSLNYIHIPQHNHSIILNRNCFIIYFPIKHHWVFFMLVFFLYVFNFNNCNIYSLFFKYCKRTYIGKSKLPSLAMHSPLALPLKLTVVFVGIVFSQELATCTCAVEIHTLVLSHTTHPHYIIYASPALH